MVLGALSYALSYEGGYVVYLWWDLKLVFFLRWYYFMMHLT